MEPRHTILERQIILALDSTEPATVRRWLQAYAPPIRWCKVGLALFVATGRTLVDEIHGAGCSVFLDLKLHDIPHQVGLAVEAARGLGVGLLSIHSSGGPAMMEAAVEAAGDDGPRLLAITVLTSLGPEDLATIKVTGAVEDVVVARAKAARDAGVHGVVCSPREIRAIRAAIPDPSFLVVTPGIRFGETTKGDQKRVTGPLEALDAGASMLVIGRSLTAPAEPARALHELRVLMGGATNG